MKKAYYLSISTLLITTCLLILPEIFEINTNTIIEAKNPPNLIPQKVSELQQNQTLSQPRIISPTDGQIINGTVQVIWTKATDSLGNTVLYTFSISQDGLKWRDLASDIEKTSYNWDTTGAKWCDYYIKVKAECSAGLTSESDRIKVIVRNSPLELKFMLTLLLFAIIIILLVGIILYRKRGRISSREGMPSIKDLKIGLSLGSFTDKGLVIKGKNANCPFSLNQIQQMLEYSAALYQHGKTDTMYGPIPLTSLREDLPEIEPSQTDWRFVTYWMKIKDSTVEDPRIKKIGGVVSAVFLFFYPKQFDQLVIVKKKTITDIFNIIINSHTDISDFTTESLNQIEEQLMRLFLS
ncbi:MAG: hypothetical protein ACFFC6_01490 [Promethearchaeota archaeon]